MIARTKNENEQGPHDGALENQRYKNNSIGSDRKIKTLMVDESQNRILRGAHGTPPRSRKSTHELQNGFVH
jgi:hypothetical protein